MIRECQCESALCTHNKRGQLHQCPNEATEMVRTTYGPYNLCKRCADHYEKDGYVKNRFKLP